MPKVIGRSGVELELDESTAASLVKQGVATYADEGDADSESTPDSADELEPGGEVPQSGQAVVGDDPEEITPVPGTEPPAPAADAPKTEWVEYAVRVHGARFGEAKAMTKAELIDRYAPPR